MWHKCRDCASGTLNKEKKVYQAKIKSWDKFGTNRLKKFVLGRFIHPYKQRVIGSSPITPTKRKNCAFARFQNKFEKHRLFACFFSICNKSHFIGDCVATVSFEECCSKNRISHRLLRFCSFSKQEIRPPKNDYHFLE